MVEISSISLNELAQRRRQLRNQRRLKNLQSVWQVIAMAGLTVGTVWALTLPGWVISSPAQVEIKGNRFLSTKTILSLIPLSYPQSLLRLQPHELAEKLEANAPIRSVTVTRQLIPPKLMIEVRERLPVAVTVPAKVSGRPEKTFRAGFLDDSGKWMPVESYVSLDEALKLPALKIVGMQESFAHLWPEMYSLVRQSSVKIMEIDWRDTTNLILKTEMGTFHLGSYSTKFAEQLNVMSRMKKLNRQLEASRIAYIDLKNPESPIVQVIQSESLVKPRNR